MKKTLLTIAAVTGLALGGLAVAGAAGAQTDSGTSGVETIDIVKVQVQDEVDPGTPEADGERPGHRKDGCDADNDAETTGVSEDISA